MEQQTATAAYVAQPVDADGFEGESNSPLDATPTKPQTDVSDADVETASTDQPKTAVKAPERDKQGRFAARDGQQASEPDEDDDEAPKKAATSEPEPEKKAKPKEDPEARIKQMTARQRDAERRAEAAERRAQELEARLAAPRTPTPQDDPAQRRESPQQEWQRLKALPGAPKEDDFDSYADFTAALGVFIADTRMAQREQRATQQAAIHHAHRERQARTEKFTQAIDAAVKADPAFVASIAQEVLSLPTFDALRPGERPRAQHFIGEELMRSEVPERLMRFWTEHPEEFQALASLPPREITRRMAIAEARLTAAPAGPVASSPVLSQAKPPVRPVTGSPVLSDDAPHPDDDDLDAHMRFYNARERQVRRGR